MVNIMGMASSAVDAAKNAAKKRTPPNYKNPYTAMGDMPSRKAPSGPWLTGNESYMGSNIRFSGGGGGGGFGGFDPGFLLNYAQSLGAGQAAAKAANLARYGEIKGGYEGLESDVLGQYDKFGTTSLADIDQAAQGQVTRGTQDLTTAGTKTGSIVGSMKQGVARNKGRAQREVAERKAMLKGGAMERIRGAGGKLGMMERRTDAYPSSNLLASLAQNYGSGIGGGNFSGPRRPGWATPGGGRSQGVSRGGGVFHHY